MKAILRKRVADSHGSGHFGASRGNRTHNGQDYYSPVGTMIASPVTGVVTKIGYPYADDLSFRYVEVTDKIKLRHRVFYIHPLVDIKVGVKVSKDSGIGITQDLSKKHHGIRPHVHYEIKDPDGHFLNPEPE